MYVVAKNIKEVLTKPIGLTRDVITARAYLNAPAALVTVQMNHKTLCKTKPFICDSFEDAVAIQAELKEVLKRYKHELPQSTAQDCYEPQITNYINGKSKVTLQVYVIKRQLPIGRNIKEASTDPLGFWSLRDKDPIFEDQPLKLSSGILRSRFKTVVKLQEKFSAEIAQGIIKPIYRDKVFRPKFRFLKAPRYTFGRDVERMKAGSRAAMYKHTNQEPNESEDLFNKNIRLVESEGDGRRMGL